MPPALGALRELALDLRWTWSHEADALWARADSDLWERTHNPWTILEDLSAARLGELAADGDFLAHLGTLVGARNAYLADRGWFAAARGDAQLGGIAYFSMEFGVGEALPVYAGGLGILAGDALKAASDLGLPVIGIGLLYQEGYFRQTIDASGRQIEVFPVQRPLQACRSRRCEWRAVAGSTSRSSCRDEHCDCACGAPLSDGHSFTCWTATTR